MTRLKISVLFAFISSYANAQFDSSDFKNRYQRDVIYLSVPGYIKNDTRFSKLYLKTEFGFSSEGTRIFKLHLEDATKSFVCVSLGVMISGASIVTGNFAHHKVAEVLSYASLVPIAVSIPLAIRSNKRMKRAIWLRNRDVLLN
jgi:hypothetical protein